MALTVQQLVNNERFSAENTLPLLLYMPIGIILLIVRIILLGIIWIASIVLPDKWPLRQMLSTLACWTFGLLVKLKGKRDPQCSVLVANYVSCLDSLAAAQALGTISLRRWNLPPFFASTLGIRNASQFARKQHFAETPSKPVLLQPEGGPTNGKGLLQFTDWPFPLGNRVQPVAITMERVFPSVSGAVGPVAGAGWLCAGWLCACARFAGAPLSVCALRLLPPLERGTDDDLAFAQRCRKAIADALQIEMTEFTWDELCRANTTRRAGGIGTGTSAPGTGGVPPRAAQQVKEVLPSVPIRDILRDLAKTRSVDVTITNFLEGLTPYTPETVQPQPGPSSPTPDPSTPRYVTPVPTGTFPKTAKERQLSFQERKAQMVAEARRRYIEKHGLNIATSF